MADIKRDMKVTWRTKETTTTTRVVLARSESAGSVIYIMNPRSVQVADQQEDGGAGMRAAVKGTTSTGGTMACGTTYRSCSCRRTLEISTCSWRRAPPGTSNCTAAPHWQRLAATTAEYTACVWDPGAMRGLRLPCLRLSVASSRAPSYFKY